MAWYKCKENFICLSKIFVNGGALDDYLSLNMLRSDRVYQKGELSDDRKLVVFVHNLSFEFATLSMYDQIQHSHLHTSARYT